MNLKTGLPEDVLAKSDNNGGGVKFVDNPPASGTFAFTFVTNADDTTGQGRNTTHTFTVPNWNDLSIKGVIQCRCVLPK